MLWVEMRGEMTATFSAGNGTDHSNDAIFTDNLTKKFDDQLAVNDVTFFVPKGSIFGFIGPSGSGKTTTIRLLTGIYEPTSGTVTVLGRDPKKFTAKQREKIGYMPQLFVLYPDLSVWENLNFMGSLYGMSWLGRGKILHQALDFVELDEHRNKLVKNISGGMQRRLSLASTLIHNPDLIFLDEPTAGIDPVLRRKFWEHFQDLKGSKKTLFITTQYVGEAVFCDFVAVLANGRLLVVDTPDGLRRRAFNGDMVDLTSKQPVTYQQLFELQDLPFVYGRVRLLNDNSVRITVDDASVRMPELVSWCNDHKISVESINQYVPPFDDVFVELVQSEEQTQGENHA